MENLYIKYKNLFPIQSVIIDQYVDLYDSSKELEELDAKIILEFMIESNKRIIYKKIYVSIHHDFKLEHLSFTDVNVFVSIEHHEFSAFQYLKMFNICKKDETIIKRRVREVSETYNSFITFY